MNTPSEDAQRELERRALRNVRGLVDKLEDGDRIDKRVERRMLAGIVIVAVLVAVVIAIYLMRREGPPAGAATVTLPPVKSAPQK